jgi:hypothetical protein
VSDDHVGGGWATEVTLGPSEEIIKQGEIWHRQTSDKVLWFTWPPPSYGKLALTSSRIVYLPPKWFLLALDHRLDAPLADIRSATIVSSPQDQDPVMAFHKSFEAWDTLRLQIGGQVHWFAMEGFTIADQTELEDWLSQICAATGLEPHHEQVT